MSSEPTAVTPPVPEPKRPSALWKWIKRIGCALFLMAFTCCGLTCTGGWWLFHLPWQANREEVDRVFAEGLQGGDVKAMFEHADPKFREKYTQHDLQKFIDEHPGILDRKNFHGMTYLKFQNNGQELVRIRSIPSLLSEDDWDIVCKVVNGVLVLVGITPGLEAAIPPILDFPLRGVRGRGGHRRHRWFD